MGNQWVKNSLSLDMIPSTGVRLGLVILGCNLGILIHSHYINKEKKKLTFVQQSTNTCATASVLGAVAVIITGFSGENFVITATFYDLLFSGFWATAAICDMYMFWERFMSVDKNCPMWKNFTLQAYIWMTQVMWILAYSLLPFYCDTNTESFWKVYGHFSVASGYLVLLYNLYFTLEFSFVLYKAALRTAAIAPRTGRAVRRSSCAAKRAKIVAIKSIIHCISSSTWNVVASYSLGVGGLLFLIFIPLGLHVLFNCKLENIGKQQRTARTTSRHCTVHDRSTGERRRRSTGQYLQKRSAGQNIPRYPLHEINIVNPVYHCRLHNVSTGLDNSLSHTLSMPRTGVAVDAEHVQSGIVIPDRDNDTFN